MDTHGLLHELAEQAEAAVGATAPSTGASTGASGQHAANPQPRGCRSGTLWTAPQEGNARPGACCSQAPQAA